MREVDRSREGVKIYTGVNAKCFLYTNNDGKPCAVCYSGKKNKSSFRFRYRTTEDAVNAINDFISRVAARQEEDKLQKIKDAKIKKEFFIQVKVGSIFVNSWGYDQTNVDAYQVIEKKGSATLVLKEICLSNVSGSNGFDCCNVIPMKDTFLENAEPFEKRINRFGISMNSYSSAGLWDGKESYYKSWYA